MTMVFQPRPIIVAGCLLALGACTSDPNQAGFLSGVYNIASGTYDQQAAELEAELSRRQIELGSGSGSATQREIEAIERDNARLQEDIGAFFAALR
jgi:hypothetical protein